MERIKAICSCINENPSPSPSILLLYNGLGGSPPPPQPNPRPCLHFLCRTALLVATNSEGEPQLVWRHLRYPPTVLGWETDFGGGAMSRNNNGKGPKMDLKLNLSQAARRWRGGPSRSAEGSQNRKSSSSSSSSSSPTSPVSSCVSSESDKGRQKSESPEATSMVLAGCPHCLMYVMLSEKDHKCPKCKNTVLVDFNGKS